MDGAVVERIMGEVRKTKVELESDMAALRAFTQQAVGGEGDLWQLQVVVLACVRVHVCTCANHYAKQHNGQGGPRPTVMIVTVSR